MDSVAQARELVLAARPEHDSQDRLEREVAHTLERRDPPAPACELALGELRDQRLERAHALPVERRLYEPPFAQMFLTVQHEDRVLPGERAQELPTLPSGGDRRIEAEDLPDRVRVGERHHRLVGPESAERHRVAEALVHALQEGGRPDRPSDRLPAAGARGPGFGEPCRRAYAPMNIRRGAGHRRGSPRRRAI